MPEIPELEAFKHYFEKNCLHKNIVAITASDKKVIHPSYVLLKKSLVGNAFKQVQRKGKFLIITLMHSNEQLVMHFGLTGYLCYTKNSDAKIKFSVVTFLFNDHTTLHWNSIRKFGKIWVVKAVNAIPELRKLGSDPLTLTQAQFIDFAQSYRLKNVKSFLMDQSIMSGIGNEYSDEILFQAGINPHHSMKDLSLTLLKKLYKNMLSVLKYSIKVQINHIVKDPCQQFFSQDNRKLFKSSYLQAHRHIDLLCPKNKNHKLKKETIAGRTTFYCPIHQK